MLALLASHVQADETDVSTTTVAMKVLGAGMLGGFGKKELERLPVAAIRYVLHDSYDTGALELHKSAAMASEFSYTSLLGAAMWQGHLCRIRRTEVERKRFANLDRSSYSTFRVLAQVFGSTKSYSRSRLPSLFQR